jgi:hypothetical protein
MRSGIPHGFPLGRLGRVQVAVRIEPDDPEPSDSRGERLDGADVRAAAAAHDERPLGKRTRERQGLLGQRVLVHDAGLGIGQLEEGRLDHRLPSSPQAFGTRTSRRDTFVHRMALVLSALEGHAVSVGTRGSAPAESTRLNGSWDQLV